MAYAYGQWDGYFVEDDREKVRREQWEASLKKQQQQEIAEELSRQEQAEYGNEILEHMCNLEVNTRPHEVLCRLLIVSRSKPFPMSLQ